MREALAEGFATRHPILPTYLTRKGLPFRDAHAAVGLAVRRAEELGADLAQLPLAELRQSFSPLIAEDVFAVLTDRRIAGRAQACWRHSAGTGPGGNCPRPSPLGRAAEPGR
jgi:argininosuccinate lyase